MPVICAKVISFIPPEGTLLETNTVEMGSGYVVTTEVVLYVPENNAKNGRAPLSKCTPHDKEEA